MTALSKRLTQCIAAKLLPANLLTRRAAIPMRSYISGLMENWLFAPDSFDLMRKYGLRRDFTEMYHSARRCAAMPLLPA